MDGWDRIYHGSYYYYCYCHHHCLLLLDAVCNNVTATLSHQQVLGFAGVREGPSNHTNDDAAEPAHYYRNARLSVHLTKDSTHHLDTPNIQVWID
jgi:hypothetical protein